MSSKTVARATLFVTFAGLAIAPAASAQREVPADLRVRIDEAANASVGTPRGEGLLPTARAEAEIAVRHVGLAAANEADLDAMKLHVGHALHAIDPEVVTSGPGLGYGVRRAAQAVAEHLAFVRDHEESAGRVRIYSRYVATLAKNVVERADSIVAVGNEIREAASAVEAAELLERLTSLGDALIQGVDANRDGGVGWRRGEGGLEQAGQYLTVLERYAGMAG